MGIMDSIYVTPLPFMLASNPNYSWYFINILVVVILFFVAVFGTMAAHFMLSMKHQVRHVAKLSYCDFHKHVLERYVVQTHKAPERLPVIFGRSVDFALQDLLDLAVRDLISSWLKDLSFSSANLQQLIKEEIWLAIGKLHDRLSNIDITKLIAVDIVSKITNHFEKIRSVQASGILEPHGVFYLSNHLMNPDKELNYLRKTSELILTSLFSKTLMNHTVNKNLLIEMSACKVLHPLFVLVTNPHYINCKLLEFTSQFAQNANLQQKCTLAESYQEFIRLIRNNEDVDYLKHLRYIIVTEIMQATTIQNLRKSKDLDKEKCQTNAKKLKRYLGQLTFAKTQCEERLKALGYSGFNFNDAGNALTYSETQKILPFERILESVHGRRMLSKFLETSNQEYLLVYWAAVEELRSTDKTNWHQIGAEIYYTFVNSPMAPIKVEKSVRRRMESFLLGNSGPQVFYDVQESVADILKRKIYPAFVSSEYFAQFLQNADAATQVTDRSDDNQLYVECDEKSESVVGKTGYAKSKLSQLQERLNTKSQALQALKISLKPESKVLCGLQKEVENLEGEKRQLEAHLTRTEAWSEHLGKWRAIVQSAEIPDEKEPPQFVLVVHVLEDESDSDAVSTGWVVLRKLTEFHELHRKLLQVWNGVKTVELPSQSPKFLFGKSSDRSSLDKAKQQIQKYLEFVLMDERLSASEALYTFLSPSSEHLKGAVASSGMASPKKTRFSLSTLFKSSNQQGNSEGSRDSDDDEMSLFDEDIRLNTVEGKDAIAEPLYALLGEIFDLRGVFRWLRKTLITFVQITYGRTINRQVGETVAWLFSEQMLHYYVQVLTRAWWPNGVLVAQNLVHSEEEKKEIRSKAKVEFVNNVPEVLNNLVGQQNARRGAIKIFEVLQDAQLNKHLFYELFELLMCEIFPELKKTPKSGKKSAT